MDKPLVKGLTMIQVFPVKAIANPPDEFNSRGGKCRKNVWWSDWHNVTRRNVNGERVPHHAQDIFAPSGSRILSPESGLIIGSSASSGPTPRGGHWLRLLTSNRVYYMSHLLDTPDVAEGQEVRAGQVLGRVGKTGNAATTCPHLHIGARKRVGSTQRGGAAINIASELRAAQNRATVVENPDDTDAAPDSPSDERGIEETEAEQPLVPVISVPGRLPVTTGPVPPIPPDALSDSPVPTESLPDGGSAEGETVKRSALSWFFHWLLWALALLLPRVRNDDKRR